MVVWWKSDKSCVGRSYKTRSTSRLMKLRYYAPFSSSSAREKVRVSFAIPPEVQVPAPMKGQVPVALFCAVSKSDSNLDSLRELVLLVVVAEVFGGDAHVLLGFDTFLGLAKRLVHPDFKSHVQVAKRNNNDYRPYPFRCLWKFAAARDDLNMLPTITEIVTPYLDIIEDEDAIDIDDKTRTNVYRHQPLPILEATREEDDGFKQSRQHHGFTPQRLAYKTNQGKI
ncbi:hypothetical protein QBC45DRAFT_464884 [Copromyces sp. CBS 386.78]|nr:hypothetical protein QBC45DRAFT_464884 [Copromyces sp. CBS 386.78]